MELVLVVLSSICTHSNLKDWPNQFYPFNDHKECQKLVSLDLCKYVVFLFRNLVNSLCITCALVVDIEYDRMIDRVNVYVSPGQKVIAWKKEGVGKGR